MAISIRLGTCTLRSSFAHGNLFKKCHLKLVELFTGPYWYKKERKLSKALLRTMLPFVPDGIHAIVASEVRQTAEGKMSILHPWISKLSTFPLFENKTDLL